MTPDVEALLDSVDDLPPVAARVMSMVEDENISASDLGQILATDQALTAKLVKISNSAYYGFSRQVSTVRGAVILLRFRQVREVAVAPSLMSVFKDTEKKYTTFDLDLLGGHSVAVAVTAEAVAKRTRAAKPQDAFIAGILHDIGRLILRKAMPAELDAAVRSAIDDSKRAWPRRNRCTGKQTCHPLRPVLRVRRTRSHSRRAAIETAAGGIDNVLDRAFAFIEAASGAPERWYQAAA